MLNENRAISKFFNVMFINYCTNTPRYTTRDRIDIPTRMSFYDNEIRFLNDIGFIPGSLIVSATKTNLRFGWLGITPKAKKDFHRIIDQYDITNDNLEYLTPSIIEHFYRATYT